MGFTGSIAAGKDYAAAKCGARIVSLAAPLYALTQFFFGYGNVPRDESFPHGLRECWQKFGQWGKGTVSASYPLTAERALFVERCRRFQKEWPETLGRDWGVSWGHFGSWDGLWIDALISRLSGQEQFYHFVQVDEPVDSIQAVTNLRFKVEVDAFVKKGWPIVHVFAPEEALIARQEAQGVSSAARSNTSEHLASGINDALWAICGRSTPTPDLGDWLDENHLGFIDAVVWSHSSNKPNPDFLTVDEFSAIVSEELKE